jgi:hypothetical protein
MTTGEVRYGSCCCLLLYYNSGADGTTEMIGDA